MSAPINKPGTRGLTHVIHALGYSLKGLRAALRYEEAFRLELIAGMVLMPLALLLGDTGVERALLFGSLTLVLVVELINSAIEAVVDRISVEYHTLAGRAKDIGSAAVFMAMTNVIITWLLILGAHWF